MARGLLKIGLVITSLTAITAGCSSGPNHIGNPITLPGRAILHSLGEASYKARRARVSRYAAQNLPHIHADIRAGGGPALTQAMDIAGVEPGRRAGLAAELRSDPALYLRPDIEPLVVALMVHSN